MYETIKLADCTLYGIGDCDKFYSVGNINHSQIHTWLSAESIRVWISQDLVGQSDKRVESTIKQGKLVEFISEVKLLGR